MQIKRAIVSLAVALVTAGPIVPAAAGDPSPPRGSSAQRTGVTDVIARRPAATEKSCTPRICVHYTTTGRHAAARRFAGKVRTIVDGIHLAYKKAGYLTPLSDHGVGGDDRTDIYLRDVGARGSRCLTDDPRRPLRSNTWAFCVLDNNFSHREFPVGTPTANLKVTAAHEYFHAIQLAYDSHEDGWIRESTATWAADQLFPSSARMRQYLTHSPMSEPTTPLDSYLGELHGFPAGTAILWRYLSEHFPTAEGGMPTFVRNVWRRLDAHPRAQDDYSLQGLEEVLGERGTTLTKELAAFADANRHPADSYVDGADYEPSALGVDRLLTAASPGPKSGSKDLDHLTSYTVRFTPGPVPAQTHWQLTLVLDLDDLSTGSAAMVTRYLADGTTKSQRVVLDASGAATLPVAGDFASYRYVEVTLVNASSRTDRCGTDESFPLFSCSGKPLDDNRPATATGTMTQVVPPPRG